jgi:hypothetical protein
MRWVSGGIGIFSLYSMDRVYQKTGKKGLFWHSGSTLVIGLVLTALFLQLEYLFYPVLLFQGILYGIRKYRFLKTDIKIRSSLTILRVGLGIILPVVFGPFTWVGMLMVLSGEIIDRCEYYLGKVGIDRSVQGQL